MATGALAEEAPYFVIAFPSAFITRHRYHLLRGDCGAYTCWLVSDVGEGDMRELAGMLVPSAGSGE